MTQPIIYLGIDWGASKIGLAIGDNQTKLAIPYGLVDNWQAVTKIIEREQVDQLVIGQPQAMSGQSIDYHPGWLELVNLAKNSQWPVHLVDERLSSAAADRLINHQKAAAQQDAVAAMLILQTFLDNYEAHQ